MEFVLWSTTTYCCSCEKRIPNSAQQCPWCGVAFVPTTGPTLDPEDRDSND